MQLVDGEYTHLFCDDADAVWRQTNRFFETMSQEMDGLIVLFFLYYDEIRFVRLFYWFYHPFLNLYVNRKKRLLRIWGKQKRKRKFRTKNTTSQCYGIDKTL